VNGAHLTVLIIDDEPQIRRLVRNAVAADDGAARDDDPHRTARVLEAATGQAGIDFAAAEHPDVIILDLGLPDMDGAAVCREVRRWSKAPIIVLSARHLDTEKAELLDAGADDYVTKPFSTVELMARLRAQLRRASGASTATDQALVLGNVKVDVARKRIERDGAPIHLTRTEWALLSALARHPRRTLTHRQLFREVWGNASGDAQQYLRVYVGHLRRKLETDPVRPQFILTEAGIGYRFEAPE